MAKFDVTYTFEYVKDKLDMHAIAKKFEEDMKELGYICTLKTVKVNTDDEVENN